MSTYPKQLAEALNIAYKRVKDRGGWRSVSSEFFNEKIPAGTLNRIAKSNGRYLPSIPEYLQLLKVPYQFWPWKALFDAKVISKRDLKGKKTKSPKSIQAMSNRELLYALENRTEVQ